MKSYNVRAISSREFRLPFGYNILWNINIYEFDIRSLKASITQIQISFISGRLKFDAIDFVYVAAHFCML